MRANEVEITSVPDKALKKILKRPIKDIKADTKLPSSRYVALNYPSREPRPSLHESNPVTAYDYFSLFLPSSLWTIVAEHMNIAAEDRLKAQKKNSDHNSRAWHHTTGPEVEILVGVYLLMGLCKLGSIPEYWNLAGDKPINLNIQHYISLKRWEQLQRYLKVSNPRMDVDSLGPLWYEKLQPILTYF